ncbi:MAG: SUMF1/EgtB/PvdO family nonheme iron enzyme [Bacteroidales bacterium]|nr:SUMF1/EgtB/PvdO family nonheme iron enzyme [Bacteroidales bacterium]MDT8373554.1 SUMF1/EgtB/PvdO family nonheme iron enzyme [Bacteroidales bacterium]
MSGIIEGYDYDVFISYRQKDNKYDGWVTEFVENLKRELDSMFKEEISVYFDINPSDYLLENYDVDASLKDKLKCLVFMPIISRTYCDPKAFAWEYEYKAFVELASKDEFGLQVKVPGGNFANRVLPIRIHDLDNSDVKLFESTIGGVLRPIDFIYKETGVNRQLRAKDDDIIKSPTQILYRDQVNKVALATREIIKSMMSRKEAGGTKREESAPEEASAKQTDIRAEADIKEKTESGSIPEEKTKPVKKEKSAKVRMKPGYLIAAFILLVLIACSILLFNYRSKVKWAREEALTEAENLFEAGFYFEPFNLLKKAERYIPKDTILQELLAGVSSYQTILTDPPGADIYMKEYSDTAGNWAYMGKSPVDSLQVPKHTIYRIRIGMAGYDTLFGATTTMSDTLSRKLWKIGELPEGMVWVDGYWDEVKNRWEEELGFFLDKYEVTNKQFKDFVDHGGYRNRDYWKQKFIKDGKKLSWEEAMAEFVDKTGRPGPSTWEAGDYPDGHDDHPVSGISWYEAVAYAEYAGKELPTADHWDSGVGFQFNINPTELIPLSNFDSPGSVPVGRKPGISYFGAFDMAGNVREWCWNETNAGRIVGGGAYDGPTYMFLTWDHLPSFDRSPLNGFRCAMYTDRDKIPETAFRYIEVGITNPRDCASETPVPENTFLIYKNQFRYDKKDLNTVVEMKDETSDDWVMEKVTFDAAYDNQRMIAFLFLPKNASPPYQTLIFFPGSYAVSLNDFVTEGMGAVNAYFDYVLKSGRAAVYPVYFRTFERNDGTTSHGASKSHEYTELLVKLVRDFMRTVDYLETRDDIDTDKLGYYGHSWGGRLGAIIPAVDDRIALNILVAAGFPNTKPYPEADEINYISRVEVPTLILNGRYDAIFPLETNVMSFYDLLGTPDRDKRLHLIDAGHNFYKKDRIKPILEWCDKYFGPPDYLEK